MAVMATISPATATKVQTTVEAAVPAALSRGFAGDTPATTVPRPLATPIARTIKAVKVTIASGDASLSSSR